MNRVVKFFALLFLACILFSLAGTVTLEVRGASAAPAVASFGASQQDQIASQSNGAQLPDTDSTMLSTILSAVGGFGGGGILLIFLVRRFIQSYDEQQKKWEDRFTKITDKYDQSIAVMWEKWSEKYEKMSDHYDQIIDNVVEKVDTKTEKLVTMMDETKDAVVEIKFEMAKFKENAVTRETCYASHSVSDKDLATLKAKVDSLDKRFRQGNG